MKFLELVVLLMCVLIAQSNQFVPATANVFTYTGRHYLKQGVVYYDWPCFKISFCFETSDKLTMKLKDTWNIYQIVLDGEHVTKIQPGKNTNVTIFESKDYEEHCVEIVKITQNHYGPIASHTDSAFQGIYVSGGYLTIYYPHKPTYHFDFLGDSLTTAFGVLSGRNPVCFLKMKHIQNCRESWANHLASKFDASARLMAVSGKGVLHNAYGVPGPKMGDLYSRITDNSKAHSYQYQDGIIPDVMFYFIGSNDYSHPLGPDSPLFVNAYKQMLQSSLWNLKQKDPEAQPLLICVGAKEDFKSKRMNENIQRAVREFRYGYKYVYYVEVPHSAFAKENLGCIGHPNVKGQRLIADLLYEQVRPIFQAYL